MVMDRYWKRLGNFRNSSRAASSDPLLGPIREGLAAGNAKRRPTQETRKRARTVRDHARAAGCQGSAVPELKTFVRAYPRTEEFQKIAARMLEEAHDKQALEAWRGISLRFPEAMDAFHKLATLTHRDHGPAAVLDLVRKRFPSMPKRFDQLLAYAEACDLAGATVERQASFEQLARIFEKRKDPWLVTTSWLQDEVGIHRFVTTILKRFAAGAGLGPPILGERQRLSNAIGELAHDDDHDEDHGVGRASPPSVRVLGALFDRVLEARTEDALAITGAAGPLLLFTGSLGTGGAERQLVNTAVGLKKMERSQRTLRDGVILESVGVVARSLRDRKDGAFYLPELRAADVEVKSYRELPDFGGNLETSAVRPALSALGFLPWSTAEAVIKLTDWLRSTKPAVVHIWQDGLVYAVGLAALLAGVPRIVLSGRSTPPPDRRERYPVEYDIIYKSLLRASGVKLSVNSHYAAIRYATWLDLDPDLISVIPNGVARLPCAADIHAEAAFRKFEERTGQSDFTLGAVMRLDAVKRPLLWMDAAASILARFPRARFIVVGDGPFRARTEKRAETLGITARCLFVGRSVCVGYWLSKMNALMLLSEHEGLPNALIEAQLAGIPVITSPAGGAAETLIPGATGFVTSATPTPAEVTDLVAGMVAQPGRLHEMGSAAKLWASEAFPITRMLSTTLEAYAAAGRVASVK